MRLSMASANRCFARYLVPSTLLVCLGLPGRAGGADTILPPKVSPDKPLPQDVGAAGLRLALKRLATTARLMHTTAHPDDEDGGMLTFESRGLGTHTLLMTLTRGEGGQNKVGSSLLDSLGVLRTLELLGADRYYGVDQRFSRVADFGFSKNPEETLEKWQGHDVALGDMVRVIRTFRPNVLVARFTGTSRDGHGHHQASAILTREAFRAAGDPKRFPEQIKEGLTPWQAKKLYLGRLCWDNSAECEKDYSVKINSGKSNPDLKGSYIQFAMEGLRHQLSQGAAQWNVDPGDRFSYYKLADSTVPNTADASGHESDVYAGISGAASFGEVPTVLREKQELCAHAIDLALGVSLEANASSTIISPGDAFKVKVRFHNGSRHALALNGIVLGAGPDWKWNATNKGAPAKYPFTVPPQGDVEEEISVTAPAQVEYSKPYWHRDDPATESLNTTDNPRYVTLPFPPPRLHIRADYALDKSRNDIHEPVVSSSKDDQGSSRTWPVPIAPAFSVVVEPVTQLARVNGEHTFPVKVRIESKSKGEGVLRLQVPDKSRVQPEQVAVHFGDGGGGSQEFNFQVLAPAGQERRATIRAVLASQGKEYSEGYSAVTREDLGAYYYFQPATQKLSFVTAALPANLRV